MTDTAPPGFLAAAEVSERYGVSRGTLVRYNKELAPIKINGRKFYEIARLRAWAIKRRNALTKKG
jgi:hypothetical protein